MTNNHIDIIQNILTNNPCYKANKKIDVKGVMLHSVGCPQPNAAVFIKLWNKSNYNSACVHGFIDGNTGDVHQTLPWNHRGWHCGGSANNTHIGIEMCEPDGIKYTSGSSIKILKPLEEVRKTVTRTYISAVELFAFLCDSYGLNPLEDGVIISHSEGAERKIASNHGDPEHLWDQLKLPYTMYTFRREVAERMKINTNNIQQQEIPFRVKVTATALNIRKGAGTNYPIVGCIKDQGVYTITKVSNNWGYLKSGAGYICLDYTKKI